MVVYNNYLKKLNLYCVRIEQGILGSLLIDNQSWYKVSGLLVINDFYFKNHKIIFSAILNLIKLNLNFDIIIVYNELKKSHNIDFLYLNNLIQKTPNSSYIRDYSIILHNMFILRYLLYSANNLINNICKSKIINIKNLLNTIENKIFNINKYYIKQNENFSIIAPIFDRVFNDIKLLIKNPTNISGISTGFLDLDNILSGLHKGELIIIAGRPSMGKTALSINIAQNIAFNNNLPVIIFSMEMSNNQLVMRILSSVSNLNQHLIRSGNISSKSIDKLKKKINKFYHSKIFIDESVNLNVSEIYSKSKKIMNIYGDLGLIVIDYLQLMNSSNLNNQNRTMEISEISRSLKCLAKDLNVPVVAVSQLNRSLELRNNKRPVMSDLRESGSIEQDADVILFIYRDEVYNNNIEKKGIAEIIIAKQRNGPTGIINLNFFSENLKFVNLY